MARVAIVKHIDINLDQLYNILTKLQKIYEELWFSDKTYSSNKSFFSSVRTLEDIVGWLELHPEFIKDPQLIINKNALQLKKLISRIDSIKDTIKFKKLCSKLGLIIKTFNKQLTNIESPFY